MFRRQLSHQHSTGPVLLNGAPQRHVRFSTWPMWVLGFVAMIDNVDQYIVRGTSNQIERAFGVGDFQIGILFSAFIVLNGIATAGPGQPWPAVE